MTQQNFKAEKVSQTASFTVNGPIVEIFPLFGAFEERKWESGWNPVLIYPAEEIIEEGTTFKTDGHGEEPEYLWRVSRFDPDNFLIQYLVSTPNRYWTITVQCRTAPGDNTTTIATVTYTYIGLNHTGNQLNRIHLQRMYQHDLQDWATAINTYLATLN